MPLARTSVAFTLLCLLAFVSAASGASTARILALLNRERARNSLPAGIAENSSWTAACEAHNSYERRYGALGHEEQSGNAGYTAAGNLIAQTSVLAQGIEWNRGDPYDNAPFHLYDLLNPRIWSVGAADTDGFGCVEIELGTVRAMPSSPIAYSYPGNHRRGIAFSQRAVEQPESPAQALGLGSRATGPNMFVYFDGPWTNGSRARVEAAKMSSVHGAVSLRWLDNTSSNLLAPTGAILVPTRPLLPHTVYRVHVKGQVTGVVPGTSIEAALGSCGQAANGVFCGQPPATLCVEDFATQLAACGLSHTWAVESEFSFTTTAPPRKG